MKKTRHLSTFTVPALALLLGAGGLLGCGPETPEERADNPAPPVEALPARSGSLPLEERLNGLVRADNQVVVRPEVAGRVVEVLVRIRRRGGEGATPGAPRAPGAAGSIAAGGSRGPALRGRLLRRPGAGSGARGGGNPNPKAGGGGAGQRHGARNPGSPPGGRRSRRESGPGAGGAIPGGGG